MGLPERSLYSSGDFTATSGGALTLRGDVIGRTTTPLRGSSGFIYIVELECG